MTDDQFDLDTASVDTCINWLRHTAPDSPSQMLCRRVARRVKEDKMLGFYPISIAFLRNDTLEPALPYLTYHTARAGIKSEVWFSGYADWRMLAENPESDLWMCQPDLIIVSLNLNILAPELMSTFITTDDRKAKDAILNVMNEMRGLISALQKHAKGRTILVHNFPYVSDPAFGLYDTQLSDNQNDYIAVLNRKLRKLCATKSGVYLFDLCGWTTRIGLTHLMDYRLYFTTGMVFSAQILNPLALEYARYIKAIFTPRRKCLVLDLDNTLWGGLVGEEGIEGIQIGADYPGNAFQAFQQAILDLYHRGIILAICSKNDDHIARQVLENHPDMLLRTGHFACMVINWEDKATNIRQIAEELNIGLDSFVFLDDNPAERLLVRQQIPEVLVPELPDTPADYAFFLKKMTDFDTLTLSAEDRERGRMYRTQVKRRHLQKTTTSLEDYYVSLDMTLGIDPINTGMLSRITQLTQKTNQFNLTTKRYTESDITAMLSDPRWGMYSLRVSDRFGDNGIAGAAFIFHFGNQHWEIDTFLLSCRILGRTVETAFLAFIIGQIKSQTGHTIQGWFHPTTKNTPARDFYKKHRFVRVKQEKDSTLWRLDLHGQTPAMPSWFKLVG